MSNYCIELKDIKKTYSAKNGAVEALKGVNIRIPEGEIYGIIGLSGAGKSTLVRCMNLLERPDSGEVLIKGENLMNLDRKALGLRRRKIGMIFQHFNLLEQVSVLENVCFPLEIRGIGRAERTAKALELLEKVGLKDKAAAYPSQLSGGQKQRVAIARVLANDPEILLCDEATSALDPETTKTILGLIKEIHENLGITVVVITHEMKVVKEICTRVAVLENGLLCEEGSTAEILGSPRSKAAKRLLLLEDREEIALGSEAERAERSEGREYKGVIENVG